MLYIKNMAKSRKSQKSRKSNKSRKSKVYRRKTFRKLGGQQYVQPSPIMKMLTYLYDAINAPTDKIKNEKLSELIKGGVFTRSNIPSCTVTEWKCEFKKAVLYLIGDQIADDEQQKTSLNAKMNKHMDKSATFHQLYMEMNDLEAQQPSPDDNQRLNNFCFELRENILRQIKPNMQITDDEKRRIIFQNKPDILQKAYDSLQEFTLNLSKIYKGIN